jgi:acyl carrier protein
MIGTPISNTQIYIVNTGMQLVPLGVTGEICIGGAGLARGYFNRPGLTAEKFIADPFSKEEGARLYKTGDLGRWLADGNIEYLGRIDNQVKIRGYRIELGEIENVLQQTEGVKQAVVMAKADGNNSKKLVGYIIADGLFNKEAIIANLSQKLPAYMVPGVWIQMESLPLTPNGKIDRKALPDPDISELLSNQYVAPRNEVEGKLEAIWQELLGVEKVGIHDNFFELGGHSLLAMKMVSYIERNLLLSIPINVLFQFTTISELSKYIATQSGAITQDKNTMAFELIDV